MQRHTETVNSKELDHDQIMQALNEVLESDKFMAAPQMSAFLKYVVEQAASGNMSPQNDPVVRVLAGRLRAALRSHYEINTLSPVHIVMRPGSYVPSFVKANPAKTTETLDDANQVKQASKASSVNGKASEHTAAISSAEHTIPSAAIDNNDQSKIVSSIVTREQAQNAFPDSDSQNGTSHIIYKDSSFWKLLKSKWTYQLPVLGLALAAMGIFIGSKMSSVKVQTKDKTTQTASASPTTELSTQIRPRPEKVSLFVSALERNNPLNDQLNTMMSGVFSQSDDVRVYRILEPENPRKHWPEDYLVSVDVLPLASETRVNIQLVEALTGRLTHSHDLSLSKEAPEGLNEDELRTISNFARELISQNGPLFEDYTEKLGNVVETAH